MAGIDRLRPRYTFGLKVGLALGLVVLADNLFHGHAIGLTIGLFALAVLAAAFAAHRELIRYRAGLAAASLAAVLCLLQIEHPTLLGVFLYLCALGVAVMSSRAGFRDDAWRWWQRLVFLGLSGLIRPLDDARRLVRTRPDLQRRVPALVPVLILPVVGGGLFLWLFSAANPVIEDALHRILVLDLELDPARAVFWLVVFIVVWAVLRPRLLRRPIRTPGAEGDLKFPGVTVASVSLSLLTFNALFAVQNGLDLVFLWGGAGLPEGMTLAEYAHRGAYPLIATALLAGLFVLVALAPGSASSRNRLIRGLVVLWVAQNILLVASTILRTVDYIEVYSLTRLRIAALAWMGLVAIGLVLICWRMLRHKSASWLINANVLTAGVVLAAACVVDLGSVAAAWNVRHAREVGGAGTNLDLCYLHQLGESALVSVAELEQRPLDPELQERATWLRQTLMQHTQDQQTEWRGWTWRRARRLATATSIVKTGKPVVPAQAARRNCDGSLFLTKEEAAAISASYQPSYDAAKAPPPPPPTSETYVVEPQSPLTPAHSR